MKIKKERLISICLLIVVYSIISLLINKDYILPSLFQIIESLISIITKDNFLIIVLSTVLRCFLGLILSFILALVLAVISYRFLKFKAFFEPIYIILKTIPNITYIIIALIWIGRAASIIVVCFTVVFPIFYNSMLVGFENIDDSLIQYTSMLDGSYLYKVQKVFIPLIKTEIVSSIKNCLSLGFKVSIMAEMLSQIKVGIGRELFYSKSNLLMSDIFAWTLIVIFLSSIFDYLINKISKI